MMAFLGVVRIGVPIIASELDFRAHCFAGGKILMLPTYNPTAKPILRADLHVHRRRAASESIDLGAKSLVDLPARQRLARADSAPPRPRRAASASAGAPRAAPRARRP